MDPDDFNKGVMWTPVKEEETQGVMNMMNVKKNIIK